MMDYLLVAMMTATTSDFQSTLINTSITLLVTVAIANVTAVKCVKALLSINGLVPTKSFNFKRT
ncbi:hypothetical protein VHTUMSATKI_47770 [Vibrio harveyi]